jgi:hypothetical protein
MMPNISRGSRMSGLMVYLAGGGRHNEHEEQHLVAGNSAIVTMHGYGVLDRNAALAIARDLDEPRVKLGVAVTRNERVVDTETGEVTNTRVAADVWHCSLSLRAEEGQLTDEKWGAIAQDFVDRMGFTEAGSGKADCRWVAVRHGLSTNGNDHVHIAVSLVREDGTKAPTHNDFKHAQSVCRDLERDYGLEQLESRERGIGERGIKPGEQARAQRTGYEVEAHKLERIVRAASVASVDEGEFVRRLRRGGVLIRPRFAAGRDDVVAGFSVALRPEKGTQPIWYGGGRLARDLTLPRMREGWPDSVQSAQGAVDEWRATAKNPWQYRPVAPGREESSPDPKMWKQYTDEIKQLRVQMREVPFDDRAAWAHLARETAGAFAAWSQRVEVTPGPLAQTARELSRTAQIRAHESRPKPAGRVSVAGATAMLLQVASQGQGTMAEALLLRQLASTVKAIMDMHTAVGDAQRATQIDSALRDQYSQVRDRLPAIVLSGAGQSGNAMPATGAGLDPELAEVVKVALRGQVVPGTGTPVPARIESHKPRITVTPHERDGHER